MDIYKLKEKIKLGLGGIILDTGEPLHTILTHDQINDVANTISYFAHESVQKDMVNLHSELLSKIPKGPTTERLFGDSAAVVLPSDTIKDMKHKVFILLYTLFLLGENLDDTLSEFFSFYNSFKLHKLELRQQVEKDMLPATTVVINEEECIRISSHTGKFIPTKETVKNFKNLL